MDYLNDLAHHYDGLVSIVGSLFGVLGFVFGTWRYLKERKAKKDLVDQQRKLDEALAHLKHLEVYASGIQRYSKAV